MNGNAALSPETSLLPIHDEMPDFKLKGSGPEKAPTRPDTLRATDEILRTRTGIKSLIRLA